MLLVLLYVFSIYLKSTFLYLFQGSGGRALSIFLHMCLGGSGGLFAAAILFAVRALLATEEEPTSIFGKHMSPGFSTSSLPSRGLSWIEEFFGTQPAPSSSSTGVGPHEPPTSEQVKSKLTDFLSSFWKRKARSDFLDRVEQDLDVSNASPVNY